MYPLLSRQIRVYLLVVCSRGKREFYAFHIPDEVIRMPTSAVTRKNVSVTLLSGAICNTAVRIRAVPSATGRGLQQGVIYFPSTVEVIIVAFTLESYGSKTQGAGSTATFPEVVGSSTQGPNENQGQESLGRIRVYCLTLLS